jgi:protein TonB
MTVGVSDEWEVPAGPWLVALALSFAIHGVAVWEGLILFWPTPMETQVMPVELVKPSPEPLRADYPPPAPSRTRRRPAETSREVSPIPGQERLPKSWSQTQPAAEPGEPDREVPTAVTPPGETHAAGRVAVPAAPAPVSTSESGPPGPVTGLAGMQLEAVPGGAVAAAGSVAPVPSRTTQSARPRGGYQIRPAYPAVARRAGVQGTTVLRVHIRADGSIDDVQVSRSAGHPALDEAAAAAVGRWRFDPARSGSEAVAVWVLIPVEFRLEGAN